MKLVEPPDACRALAAELRLSYADLEDMLPDDSVLDRIPRRVVKRHSCLPLFEDRGCILVACSDEPSHELEEEIRIRCGVPMRAVLAVPRSINQAIAKYYAPGMREEAAEDVSAKSANGKEAKSGKPEKTVQKPAAKEVRSKSAPLTEDQKRERLMITAIATCWSIIGTVGLFWFLNNGVVGVPQIMIGVVAGAVVFGLMKATYAR